jgi:hypothetical protein
MKAVWAWCLTLIIAATWEAEIGDSLSKDKDLIKIKTLYLKKPKQKAKRLE